MNKLKRWFTGALVSVMSIASWGTSIEAREVKIEDVTIEWVTDAEIKEEAQKIEEKKKKVIEEGLKQIQSYDQLLNILQEKGYFYEFQEGDRKDILWDVPNTQDIIASSTAEMDYSETNVQVAGVDEADIIKTDERYIYTCVGGENIAIVDTKDEMKQVASIVYNDPKSEIQYKAEKLFLDEKYLTVMLTSREGAGNTNSYWRRGKMYTTLRVYDISDKSKPTLTREVKVEGDLSEIRKIGHQIYLVTQRQVGHYPKGKYTKSDILPTYKDSVISDEMQTIDTRSMRYYTWSVCNTYTVLTSFNIDNRDAANFNILLSDTCELYMDKDTIYLTNGYYGWDEYYSDEGRYVTIITKYNIQDEKVRYANHGYVPGETLNQFSMDEYKGYFRIATTNSLNGTRSNNVYVLDANLNVVGKLEKLAEGERIYSVRFDGERGYVVTFEQVDPLFVIDLSKPTEPKVLGELKVPGFSQYLHPIGDHLVVGIGRSTAQNIIRDENGNETVTGVSTQGIKLSLFDVTNPKVPVEINHIIIGTSGSWSEALENHTAVMVDKKRQILAIPVTLKFNEPVKITSTYSSAHFQGAYVFAVEDGKLVGKAKLGQIDVETGNYLENYNREEGRVCYIGDRMYYVYRNQINVYDMDTFKCIGAITLK